MTSHEAAAGRRLATRVPGSTPVREGLAALTAVLVTIASVGPASAANVREIARPDHPAADVTGLVPIVGPGLPSTGDEHASAALGRVSGALPPDLAGWPVTIDEWRPRGGLVLVQADDDDALELLVSSGKDERRLRLLDTDGTPLPGWPLTIPTGTFSLWGASFGDVDGDGRGEVVATSDRQPNGTIAWTYAFETDGSIVPGFPVETAGDVVGSPVVVDLDGDGAAEILVTEKTYPSGRLYVFDGTGALLPGWPVGFEWLPGGSPGAVDVDGDGVREIFFETYVRLHAFRIDGTPLPGFPFTPLGGDVFSYATPTFADLDGDGRPEIAVGAHRLSSLGRRGAVWVFDANGHTMPGWPVFVDEWVYTPPTFSDLDGDNDLEIIAADIVLGAPINYVHAWHHDGTPVDGWPVGPMYAVFGQISVADMDGDGDPELVWGDNAEYADLTGRLFAYHHDGTPVAGWPLHTVGSPFNNSVAFGDVDADGDVELAVVSGLALEPQYTVYVWNLAPSGVTADVQMPMVRYGPGRDGVHPQPVTVGVPPVVPGGGLRMSPIVSPSRDGVDVSLHVPRSGRVTVDVLDVSGRRVRTLDDGRRVRGWVRLAWDATDGTGARVAAGIYVIRARDETDTFRRKVVILD